VYTFFVPYPPYYPLSLPLPSPTGTTLLPTPDYPRQDLVEEKRKKKKRKKMTILLV
jgi:hypothetical protein